VQDDKQVLRVLVDLGPLALREHVLEVERVPAEALGEVGGLDARGRVEVNPCQAVRAELSGARLCWQDGVPDRAGPRAPDARQARHRY
jgi:hypothetical protein